MMQGEDASYYNLKLMCGTKLARVELAASCIAHIYIKHNNYHATLLLMLNCLQHVRNSAFAWPIHYTGMNSVGYIVGDKEVQIG